MCLFYFHEPLNQMELNLTEKLLRWSSILCILVLLFGSSTWHLVASANYTVWLLKFQICSQKLHMWYKICYLLYPRSPKGEGGILFYLCPSVLPSVQDIFRRIFLSNCWWQKSDIWSQASYRYTILWVAFLDPSDSYFLFADFVDFYAHWTYMLIFLSNYWWQKSDI